MRKARDFVGLPVVELNKGEQVGVVQDVLFAADGRLQGLLLQRGHLFAAARIVPKERIHGAGADAVTIPSREAIEELRDATGLVRSLLEGDIPLLGKDVITQDGNLLGTVEDVYLDDELNTIVGYEISAGWLVDWKEGRKVLSAHPEIMMGADTLLVPPDTELAEQW